MGCDDIPPAPAGKMLNDAGIGIRNDENGKCGCQSKKDRKICVLTECYEGFGWSIGRRRNTISTQTDPCEEGKECNLMKYSGIFNIFLRTNYQVSGSIPNILPVPRVLGPHVIIFWQLKRYISVVSKSFLPSCDTLSQC